MGPESEESGGKTGIAGPRGGITSTEGVDGVDGVRCEGGVSGLPGTQPLCESPNIEDELDRL